MMKQKIVAVDLFCGCGGLTKGLCNAGIKVVKGVDIDPTVEESYVRNNRGTVFLNKDIRKLTPKEIMKGVKRIGKQLLLAGCAPCQPFTHYRTKTRYDRRKSLMLQFARLIDKIRPEYVLAENVPGYMNTSNRYRKEFLEILEKKWLQLR